MRNFLQKSFFSLIVLTTFFKLSANSAEMTCNGHITAVKIYDQSTDAPVPGIGALTNGMEVDISLLPANYYLVIEANGNITAGRFTVNGLVESCESVLPYTCPGGAENGNNWNGGLGCYDVDVAVWHVDGCNTAVCDSDWFNFCIVAPDGINPPTPLTCNPGFFSYDNHITVNGNTVTSTDGKFVNGGTITVPGTYPTEFSGPVNITVSDYVSWDGYTNRASTGDQPFETWKIVFIKNGVVVEETPYTADLQTGTTTGETTGSLGGPYFLPDGVDEIKIVHYEDPTYGEGAASTANSVYPSGICFEYEEVVEECNTAPTCNDECSREVSSTTQCNTGTMYEVFVVDCNGSSFALEPTSSSYFECDNGTAHYVATATIGTDVLTWDINFSGATTNPPAGSPKAHSCDTYSSAGWVYYPVTCGTLTSSEHGVFTIGRSGPSYQIGNGANVTSLSGADFGGSGWYNLSGGNGHYTSGDINVMLSDETSCSSGEITGNLYIDTNGNGVQDAGEPSLANVDVIITDSNGDMQTVSTDANGDYTATVPPGTTTVDVDENDPQYPTGFEQTEGDDPTVVSVASGGTTDAGNDGYYQPGTVSGHLYLDENGNGVQDPGDPDLANVDVIITDSNGDTQTVSTDSNGNYTATVPPGTTIVDVDENDPQYPNSSEQTEGDDPTTVTAIAGMDVDAGIDGYFTPASISGHLYIDTNGNGVQDPGEPNLANVDVIITDVNGDTQTVTTDANGDYTATVPPGTVTADIDETDPQYPEGFDQTEGNDPTIITAVAGMDSDAGNDGFYLPGTVSGQLYLDENGNGMQDPGEEDLANVDVIITDSNGDTQTVTTDADGNWEAEVPPGTTTADIDENDADYPSGFEQTEGDDPTVVTAIAGDDVDAGNDGYFNPGTVSGHLYIDENGNGMQDPGEEDLANVDVIITDSNGDTQTVSTDANGDYSAAVPPGATIVDVDENDPQYPTGFEQTEGDDPTTVTAVAGMDTDAGNDGYYQPGTVSGNLYIDTNGNGVQDGGEPNLANVDVIITDANGDMQTVTSDANGDWEATVPPGNTTADVDENDADYPTGSEQTEGDDPTTVNAVAGTNTDAGIDGYFVPASVSGHLYLDENGDGVQDEGEPNLADVDVIITDSNGDMVTVTSDVNGDWSAPVPPGTTTADVDENDPDYPTGSDQTEGDDPTTVTAVAGMDTDAGNDGYFVPSEIFGNLYLDDNANGFQDINEEDLAGVDVVITDSRGNMQTVETDVNGEWSAIVPAGITSANVDENDPQYPDDRSLSEGTDPTVTMAISGQAVDGGTDGYSPCPGEPQTNVEDLILICEGETVEYAVLNTVANADYVWEFGFGSNPSTAIGPGPHVVTYEEVAAAGTFVTISVTIIDCPPKFATVATVKVSALAPAIIEASPDMICAFETKTFMAGDVQTGAIYTWEFGDDATPRDASGPGPHDVQYAVAGMKTATLEVDPNFTDLKSCPTSDEMSFEVDDCNGTLFGHLYLDENGNGMQDPGEPNLPNVDVVITDQFGNIQIVSTDDNGDYSASVPEGPVTVDVNENDPDYPSESTQTEGTDPTEVTAVKGGDVDAGDDGYFIPAAVFGHLYLDANDNFVQDGDEVDLAGVDVIITDSNGEIQTVTSDMDGDWSAVVPAGVVIADVDETDADFPTGSRQTEGDDPTTVDVLSGDNKDAGDDGYFVPAEVFGHLYLDNNNNGVQDPGEPDLANVDVIVTDSKGNQQIITTDANGDWLAEVPQGQASADVDETDPDFPVGSIQTEGDDPSIAEAISAEMTDLGNDGYFVPAEIFGHLYLDDNNDGEQNNDEPDLADVDVIITDSNGDTQTVTTDMNGDWVAIVPAGVASAKVDESDSDFPTGSIQTEGDDPTNASAINGSSIDAGIDGYYLPATIFGVVYFDDNNDGDQGGSEPGIADVDVLITQIDGSVITATTDANGNWSATVLPGSTDAIVDESDPDFPASATQTEGDNPSNVLSERGEDKDAGNDGYYIPTEIFGNLYLDENNDGTQSPGEPSLPNVDVFITQSNGTVLTVTSDSNGNWSSPVSPGLTLAKVDTNDPDFPANATQTEGDDPTITSVPLRTVHPGGVDGYFVPATVFGHVYLDENSNGVQDGSEPDIANVDVIVTDASGNTQTVMTDANGDWTAEVIAGNTSALVDESDPDFPMNTTQTEGTNPTSALALSGLSVDNGIDGYTINFTDITPIISFIPGVVNGPSPMAFQIRVQELLDVPTNGEITLVFPRDPRLTFAWEPTKSSVGPFALENSKWIYDDTNATFHIWRSTEVIPALGSSTFGWEALYNPENSSGEVTYTITIISNSGGENNVLNNIDAETLVYFNN